MGKIGILTQPLHDNYGGLLQAYALKEILEQLNNEVVIINRQHSPTPSLVQFLSIIKRFILNNKKNSVVLSESQKQVISKNTRSFREKYIPNLSAIIVSDKEMQNLNNHQFDAFVVGSDQCWRPKYSPQIYNYFLDFVSNNPKVKKISYAASFGVSDWEFTNEQTIKCKQLIQNFDAISVREDSGIDLISCNLNRRDGVHVLDPTMLLAVDHYKSLLNLEGVPKSPGNLKVYILDKNKQKIELIDKVETLLGLKSFEVLPNKRLVDEKPNDSNIIEFMYPNPLDWIKGFEDAEFVVTDSFHGTVFSILFNKPFLVIGNKHRGMARFESLLNIFDLKDRLILENNNELDRILNKQINWSRINEILEDKRNFGLNFLKNNL